jgi:hypothetical protein
VVVAAKAITVSRQLVPAAAALVAMVAAMAALEGLGLLAEVLAAVVVDEAMVPAAPARRA